MENSPAAAGTAAGGLPPLTSRFTAAFGVKPESPLPSSLDGDAGGRLFSKDVSSMPDLPPRNHGHRRARSEILSLPDDISFDSDLGVVGADGPSLSDETDEDVISLFMDVEKLAASCAESSGKALVGFQVENAAPELNARPKIRHQHSLSMDGSASMKAELLAQGNEVPTLAETKKAMSAQQLAELARIDPKRAKRIWANRQSAARSKERKMRYIQELERRVQTLQTEATTLSAQLTMLQRDTTGLTAENNELKLRLQTMEQQVHLQDALNDALREEVQRLKLATGQLNMVSNSGQMVGFGGSNYGVNQQFFPQNQSMQSLLAAQQLQQLQIHSHQQPQQQQQLLSHQNQRQHQPQQTQQQTSMKSMGVLSSPNQNETSSSNNAAPKE